MNEITPGRYRHYKGNEYTVIGVARHSETLDDLVVYRQEYGEHSLWVRPQQMFLENVKLAGREFPRFQHLTAEAVQGQEKVSNIYHDLPPSLPQELVQILLHAANVHIERIVSHGHASPPGFWYDQDRSEWVVVLKGAARLRFEAETVEMKAGDYVNIPAHKKHRVEWTTADETTIWLAVHYGLG